MSINSESILQAIEEMWGYQLPRSYRSFLLLNNGGSFEQKIFTFAHGKDGSCIDEFFRLKKGFNDNILLKKNYAGVRIPENFLPIARDVYGNLILISVKNADRGKIYFWDHEREAGDGEIPDYSNLTLIADSFDDFINNLKSEEDLDL